MGHPFLRRFSREALRPAQLQAFGLQHYQLVRVFTTYMTHLIARMPDWTAALRPVLDDEFGQYTIFRSHVHLYRTFLKALGLKDEDWGRADLAPQTKAFIDAHLQLTREGDILMALGAIGPGHESSIPVMFPFLLEGLRRNSCLSERELEYFTMHIKEDKEHAVAFNTLIQREARGPQALERVAAGAAYSLDLRHKFWDGLEHVVFGSQS
jgi:diaminobutyrate-2-oxoglutarate transaminase/pyrroloquinoline-quinone synthase